MRTRAILAALAAAALLPVATAGGDATSTGQDAAHTGVASDGAPVAPLGKRWEVDLGETEVRPPLIAGGRVFVLSGPRSDGSSSAESSDVTLRALDAATGRVLWSRALTRAAPGIAFDAGRVLVLDDGALRAFAASNGEASWSARPPGDGTRFTSAPVAADGTVYAAGTPPQAVPGTPLPGITEPPPSESAGVYALRSADGGPVWAAPATGERDEEGAPERVAPALDGERVYLATGCGAGGAEAFARSSGARVWQSPPSGERTCGGRPGFPQVSASELFVPTSSRAFSTGSSFRILDPRTGDETGSADSRRPAALPAGLALLTATGLIAQDRPGGLTRWSWPPGPESDIAGSPVAQPLVAGPVVYVLNGSLIALRLGDGAEVWRSALSDATRSSSENGSSLAAGSGFLVAARGGTVTGFAPGPDAPGLSTRPPATGELMLLSQSRSEVVFGRRIRLKGAFFNSTTGGPGRTVLLEADPFPYDDAWAEVARTRADDRGEFTFDFAPERNTRLRFRDPETADGVGKVVTVLSDFGVIQRNRLKGRRVTTTVRIVHSPGQRLARRKLHFYLVRSGRRPVRRASRVLRSARRGEVRARATFRVPRPREGDLIYVCVRESVDDGYGKRYAFDRTCGRRRL